MSTVKVAPEKTFVDSLFSGSLSPEPTKDFNAAVGSFDNHEEYMYIFCILMAMLLFGWTFKKRA
jgi:hypothetical protein|tara:strand:+ start:830 stop:1021 length:192 start_codon:yes stop_codon:yes gene_type:complete